MNNEHDHQFEAERLTSQYRCKCGMSQTAILKKERDALAYENSKYLFALEAEQKENRALAERVKSLESSLDWWKEECQNWKDTEQQKTTQLAEAQATNAQLVEALEKSQEYIDLLADKFALGHEKAPICKQIRQTLSQQTANKYLAALELATRYRHLSEIFCYDPNWQSSELYEKTEEALEKFQAACGEGE